MAIQKEIWIADIQEKLFEKNLTWLNTATDMSSYAVAGFKVVNIPVAGGDVSVSKNYSGSFPRTVTQRTDAVKQMQIDSFPTAPMIVTNVEAVQVAYDKRASIMNQHVNTLSQVIGSEVIRAWAPASTGSATLFTTGPTSSAWLATGQTGTRKLPTFLDLVRLQSLFDEQNVPDEDRYIIMPEKMYNSFYSNNDEFKSAVDYYGFEKGNILPNGAVAKAAGFNIIKRPTVLAYAGSGSGDLKELDTLGKYTLTGTDNLAAIAYHKDFVAYAKNGIDLWTGIEGNPLYNGGQDMSAEVLLGASKLRTTDIGVAALIMGA